MSHALVAVADQLRDDLVGLVDGDFLQRDDVGRQLAQAVRDERPRAAPYAWAKSSTLNVARRILSTRSA